MDKIDVGIIGVSGYTGLELVKILLFHPKFNLNYIAASTKRDITELFPQLCGVCDMEVEIADAKVAAKRCSLVFLALPHKESMKFTKVLREQGVKVVDLSADYRLSKKAYEANYCTHEDEDGLKEAVYGLVEINKERIKKANLVANPGCYPTASLLATIPFCDYIDTNFGVIIDAKSGVSGAGKGLKESSHYCGVNENLNAYSPILHRHSAEISEQLATINSKICNVTFVPYLIPMTRGMVASVYVRLRSNVDALQILHDFYKNDSFIRIKNSPVRVKDVVGTHYCDIFAMRNADTLFINSAIDNLLRGASSQAVANANLICGFDENLGLPAIAHGL